jgi:hypothetical protein
MEKHIIGDEARDAKQREISDMFIDAIHEAKILASTLDDLEYRTRDWESRYHNQIEMICNQTLEARTILSEYLADHLIDQRNRVSL